MRRLLPALFALLFAGAAHAQMTPSPSDIRVNPFPVHGGNIDALPMILLCATNPGYATACGQDANHPIYVNNVGGSSGGGATTSIPTDTPGSSPNSTSAVPVNGPDNQPLATQATLAALLAKIPGLNGTDNGATVHVANQIAASIVGTVYVAGSVTATISGTPAVSISGTPNVNVTDFPATQVVAYSSPPTIIVGNFPATQQVTPATNANWSVTPSAGTTFPTSFARSCGPAQATLSSANASVSLSCPGAGGFLIDVQPTSGAPLVGTLSSTDAVTGGPHIIFKAGVGSLGVTSIPFTANQTGFVEYRTNGGMGEQITLSPYTSGSATVTIYALYTAPIVNVSGPVHSSEDEAVRQGRAYAASSGLQQMAAGNYMSLYISNPATNTNRLIIDNRRVYCDNPTGTVAPKWYSISDPTANIPTTAATIINRKTGGPASTANASYNYNVGSVPDTSPSTVLNTRVAGTVQTGGAASGPGDVLRTVEPGHSYAITIAAVSNGLTTSPICGIDFTWYEESIQ